MSSQRQSTVEVRLTNLPNTIFIVSSIASLLLCVLRVVANISILHPIHTYTTGYEENSLFDVWKWAKDIQVYTNAHEIPFSAAYFNWFFYSFYGFFTKHFFYICGDASSCDQWLPTVCRLVSFSLCLIGISVLSHTMRIVSCRRIPLVFCALCASYVFLGPLVGFNAITCRPDIGALFFEGIAILFFVSILSRGQKATVRDSLIFALLTYMSWSFKQSNVAVLLAGGAMLAVSRAWAPLLCLVCSSLLLWTATFAIGGEFMIMNLIGSVQQSFDIREFTRNISSFTLKSSPFLFVCLCTAIFCHREIKSWFEDRTFSFIFILVICSAALALSGIAKTGARDNYFFTLFLSLSLLTTWVSANISPSKIALIQTAYSVGWLVNLIFVATVIFRPAWAPEGLDWEVSNSTLSRRYESLRSCLETLPSPVYVDDRYANLPWINRGPEFFVIPFGYYEQKAEGDSFEGGGIEGLLASGYFRSAVTLNGDALLAPGMKSLGDDDACKGFDVYGYSQIPADPSSA